MGPDPPENISIYLAGNEDSLAGLHGKRVTLRDISGYLHYPEDFFWSSSPEKLRYPSPKIRR